jgi:hypothetical protein
MADREVLVARAQQSGVALSVIIRRAIRLYLSQSNAQQRPATALRSFGSSDGQGGA